MAVCCRSTTWQSRGRRWRRGGASRGRGDRAASHPAVGGFGSWSLAVSYPDKFAAIAPICGGGETIPILLADKRKQEQLKKLPIWAFHGAKDPVVKLEESEKMVNAFKRIGSENVQLTVYPEAQHDSWTETYDNPKLYDWFLFHSLKNR